MAKERNGWKSTPANLLPDIEKACVEHGHGSLWNSIDYNMREVTSIDMKACYPASFQGMGETKPYFEWFGHPTHRMTHMAIDGPLPKDKGTGFAEEWEFEASCHPVIPAWFGRHFFKGGWAPTQLLAFLTKSGLLRSLKVREEIISFENQTEVWLKMGNRSILHLFPALRVGGWRSRSVSSRITTDGSISVCELDKEAFWPLGAELSLHAPTSCLQLSVKKHLILNSGLAKLLGFSRETFEPGQSHIADEPKSIWRSACILSNSY